MSRSDLNISRWLEAHSDRSAGLTTLPRNLVLSDVSGDSDFRLVLVDLKLENNVKSKLKVYKGTVLVADQILPDIPSGVISFYTENSDRSVPAIGIACGSDLLVYKNNKPFFKFTVPPLPIPSIEEEVWRKLKEENITDLKKIVYDLKTVPFNSLSPRSQQLLSLQNSQLEDYIGRYVGKEAVKNTPITCMNVIPKNSRECYSASCPILGTECGQIYILDPLSLSILHQAALCHTKAAPCVIQSTGLFDVDFRVVISCREGYVCLLRRGWLEGKILFKAGNHIVDMVLMPGDNFIVIAQANKQLFCYTKKGNKLWSLEMKTSITCLCLVPLKYLSTCLLAVGLQGGSIQLYQGRHPVDYISTPDTPSAVTFGQMGQEEHVMVIITLGGTITFKILKRTADFSLDKQDNMAPIVQSKPLPIPKRSKMFLEQSMRERQNAIEIHQNFQQDLVRLRLRAARAIMHNLSDQTGVGNEKELIKLSAQVLGLGPKFTLILTLENMNQEKPLIDLSILFHCKTVTYLLSSYSIKVPLIPPSLSYKVETKVEERTFLNGPDNKQEVGIGQIQVIRVFVVSKGQVQPVLAATINMPPTDLSVPLL